MIKIEDGDLPIDVATKIIKGTKSIDTQFLKNLNEYFGGEGTQDMFSIEEIREIAEYLLIFVNSRPNDY